MNPTHPSEWAPTSQARLRLSRIAEQRGVNAVLPGVHALAMATRHLPGGRLAFLEYVKLAVLEGNTHAICWWTTFEECPLTQQLKVSFDDICAASGVKPSELMGAVVEIAMTHAVDVGNLVAALNHPSVVSALARSSKRITGEYADIAQKDRVAFLQHSQFLPVAKGAQINNYVTAQASAAAQAKANESAGVPSFLGDAEATRPAIQGVQQQLITEGAAGRTMAEEIGATTRVADAELVDQPT